MTLWHFPTLKLTFFSIPDTGVPLSVPVRHRGAGPIPWPSKLQGSQDEEVILYFIFHPRLMLKRKMSLDNFISNWLQGISSGVAKDGCYITTNPLTQLFRREIYNESISMGKWFQHFFANNSRQFCTIGPNISLGGIWVGWSFRKKHGWDQSHCLPSQSPTNHPRIFLAYQFFCTEN